MNIKIILFLIMTIILSSFVSAGWEIIYNFSKGTNDAYANAFTVRNYTSTRFTINKTAPTLLSRIDMPCWDPSIDGSGVGYIHVELYNTTSNTSAPTTYVMTLNSTWNIDQCQIYGASDNTTWFKIYPPYEYELNPSKSYQIVWNTSNVGVGGVYWVDNNVVVSNRRWTQTKDGSGWTMQTNRQANMIVYTRVPNYPSLINPICTSCTIGTNTSIDDTPTINVTCIENDFGCSGLRIANNSWYNYSNATASRDCVMGSTNSSWICTLPDIDKLRTNGTTYPLYIWGNNTYSDYNAQYGTSINIQYGTSSIAMSTVLLNTTTINVANQSSFVFTVNVSCNGTCGNVKIYIDPITNKPIIIKKRKSGIIQLFNNLIKK